MNDKEFIRDAIKQTERFSNMIYNIFTNNPNYSFFLVIEKNDNYKFLSSDNKLSDNKLSIKLSYPTKKIDYKSESCLKYGYINHNFLPEYICNFINNVVKINERDKGHHIVLYKFSTNIRTDRFSNAFPPNSGLACKTWHDEDKLSHIHYLQNDYRSNIITRNTIVAIDLDHLIKLLDKILDLNILDTKNVIGDTKSLLQILSEIKESIKKIKTDGNTDTITDSINNESGKKIILNGTYNKSKMKEENSRRRREEERINKENENVIDAFYKEISEGFTENNREQMKKAFEEKTDNLIRYVMINFVVKYNLNQDSDDYFIKLGKLTDNSINDYLSNFRKNLRWEIKSFISLRNRNGIRKELTSQCREFLDEIKNKILELTTFKQLDREDILCLGESFLYESDLHNQLLAKERKKQNVSKIEKFDISFFFPLNGMFKSKFVNALKQFGVEVKIEESRLIISISKRDLEIYMRNNGIEPEPFVEPNKFVYQNIDNVDNDTNDLFELIEDDAWESYNYRLMLRIKKVEDFNLEKINKDTGKLFYTKSDIDYIKSLLAYNKEHPQDKICFAKFRNGNYQIIKMDFLEKRLVDLNYNCNYIGNDFLIGLQSDTISKKRRQRMGK